MADARDYCSNPAAGQTCPFGPGASGGDITAMTDAQMATAYSGQFQTTYPTQGGIGYNAAALSRTGGSCCAANTKARFKLISVKTQYKK